LEGRFLFRRQRLIHHFLDLEALVGRILYLHFLGKVLKLLVHEIALLGREDDHHRHFDFFLRASDEMRSERGYRQACGRDRGRREDTHE